MANTIEKALQYVNNQQENLAMYNQYLLCADLIKPLTEHKGNKIEYDRMSFASYVMGDFNRASGLSAKDFVFERVEKTLTQDKGDLLALDIMDRDEAQIAGGIASVYNYYNIKVALPAMDKRFFGEISKVNSGATFTAHSSITSDNIVSLIENDIAVLREKRIKAEECLFFISPTEKAKLGIACYGRGYITQGYWNGKLDTMVELYNKMKIIEVPQSLLGENVAWAIVHPLSATFVPVHNSVVYNDKVPGFAGRRAQVEVNYYYDAWVEPTGGDGILIALSSVAKVELPDDFSFESASGVIEVTGIQDGAKVYYATSTGVTTSSTELTKSDNGKYELPSVSATTTYYVCQAINGVLSAEATVKATKE